MDFVEAIKYVSLIIGGGGAVKVCEMFFVWLRGRTKEQQGGFDFLEAKYQELQLNADHRCQREIDRLEKIVSKYEESSQHMLDRVEKLESDLEEIRRRASKYVAEIIRLGGKVDHE